MKPISYFLFILIFLTSTSCHREIEAPTSTVTIGTESDPLTLDPRLARDLSTATAIHMLYEGLTRLNEDGAPLLAAAESLSTNDDQTIYTFKIRKTSWSNGTPLTAYDFEETWKSILNPKFPAPNANQFYVIKNAKAAKAGQISLDKVGINAIDEQTLVVQLENPTPYFLNLTASFFYYPVSSEFRKNDIQSEKITSAITNGPFKIDNWKRENQLVVVKNPYYWDKDAVLLNKIKLLKVDSLTGLALFERNELDWAGSPLSTIPSEALNSLKKSESLFTSPAAGVHLFRFNVEKPPFNDPNMRKAFSLALNRKELVTHVLQGNQIPAKGFIPPPFINRTALYRDHHLTKSRESFKTALENQKIHKDDLPIITLYYAANERNHKIAQVVQQQWKEALDVDVNLQSYESKVYFDLIKKHDYQIAIGSIYADFCDPISFLEVFKFKDNGINNTQWENPKFTKLLNLSSQTTQEKEREQFLAEAEQVLMDEMPIAPIFYNSYNYLKNPNLKNVYFCELGYLDFKKAYLEK